MILRSLAALWGQSCDSHGLQTVLQILQSFPVNHFLRISGLYGTHAGELHPITYLEQPDDLPLDLVPA